jgi:hypothetical protein
LPDGTVVAERFTRAQWHTAAVWLALWLAPQLLAPTVLLADGAVPAGRVGLSLALATAPGTLGVAWLHGRYPSYAALAAGGRWNDLDRLARRSLVQALGVCAMLGVGVTLAIVALAWLAPALAERALPPAGVAALCVSSLGWVAVQGCAAWLRAERAEPLVRPTVVLALVVTAGCAAAAPWSSTDALVVLYSTGVVIGAAALASLTIARARVRHQRVPDAARGAFTDFE